MSDWQVQVIAGCACVVGVCWAIAWALRGVLGPDKNR